MVQLFPWEERKSLKKVPPEAVSDSAPSTEAGAAAPASSSRHPREKSEGHLLDTQLIFTHSPKIVTEQGLEPWSFGFRIQVEVGKLALVE